MCLPAKDTVLSLAGPQTVLTAGQLTLHRGGREGWKPPLLTLAVTYFSSSPWLQQSDSKRCGMSSRLWLGE